MPSAIRRSRAPPRPFPERLISRVLRSDSTPIHHGSRSRNAVALTFDDGPGTETARILDALADADARATFFLVGSRVAAHANAVARIAAEGHEIGSHSWGHDRPGRSQPAVLRDLVRASVAIRRAAGASPRWFRPPYARFTRGLMLTARLAGMGTVTWDVDPRDWERDDPGDVVEEVLRSTRSGSIVLLHDGGPATVESLPSIVENLRLQGLDLVTVSDLLRSG
jgi:peptidoglycan/xylan/chitin deacetylase (PgdA/CDA1 family)